MAKSIKEFTKIINEFADKRGWNNDDPRELITSLIVELGELSEHFQRKNKFWKLNEEEKKIVGYEFVDIIFYLLRLASKSGIDLEQAFDEKLPKLEVKFPLGSDRDEQHRKYRKIGKNKKYE